MLESFTPLVNLFISEFFRISAIHKSLPEETLSGESFEVDCVKLFGWVVPQ